MPIYESETITREDLEEKRKHNVCAVCQGWLNLFLDRDTGKVYLACNADQTHEGVARENNELREPTILVRRENMVNKYGQENTRTLAKYQMSALITREAATEIVETLWRGAGPIEKTKAILLCATYNLNPLMNHLFMLPFKDSKTGKTDWVVVIGIEATRLMAHRKHNYTYLDLTPRRPTPDELEKILAEAIDHNALYVITKIKDLDTGAEAYGLGAWKGGVYGAEKGNTPFNMASIHSERQALKRLYPAEMPAGVEVIDERFMPSTRDGSIEGEYKIVDETTGEVTEQPTEPETPSQPAKSTAKAVKPVESTIPLTDGIPSTTEALLAWVQEAKAFRTLKTSHEWLLNVCKIAEDRIVNDPTGVYKEVREII